MKNSKKIAALFMAVMMVLACICPTMAADARVAGTNDNSGSITITNAVVGQTYTVYQIFVLESYDTEAGAYAYTVADDWEDFIDSKAIKDIYVNVDDQSYVSWVAEADPAGFAKLAQAYAKDNNIANQGSAEATSTTVEFTGLNLGYYLVDSTLGTLCSLNTTKPNVTIEEKNGTPTNEKEVKEDSTDSFGKTNDADIGDTVYFQSTITAQAGAENYVFHDKMTEGLTYGSVTGITLNGSTVDAKNYTLTTESLNDKYTFKIEFTRAFCNTLKANDEIVISYTAIVNDKAVVGLDGNANDSWLDYGDENNTKSTPPSQTKTYTWDLDILKYANGNENSVLKDAQFVLLNKAKDKVATIVSGKLTGWANVPTAGDNGTITWPDNTVLTTNESGKIEIDGLDADTYYLRETKAPDGYNKLANDIEVVITGATKGDSDKLTYTTVVAKVNNQSGTELPSTGGIGTTIFYIVGSIMCVGAAVLLVTRKRMNIKG